MTTIVGGIVSTSSDSVTDSQAVSLEIKFALKGEMINMKSKETTRNMKHNLTWRLTILILCGVLVIPSVSLAAGDQWTQKTDIPTPRFGLCASVVNGKIYAIGGTPDGGQRLSAVEEYDPATDRWRKKADMLTPRMYLSSAAVNGKIYAIGGFSSGRTVEEYDPATNTWTRKADMPTGRFWLATCVLDGKIYAIGGSGGLSTVEVYDPAADKWTKAADMPTRRMGVAAAAVNGKIYAIGGAFAIQGFGYTHSRRI